MYHLGMLYSKLGRLDDGNRWLSESILSGSDQKLEAMAYGGLAVNRRQQKHNWGAGLASSSGMAFGSHGRSRKAGPQLRF